MKTAILCFSAPGERTARKLALTTDETVVRVAPGSLSKTVSKLWGESDALVFLSSLGIAVRASAPHLRDKAEDPAVIVVTEDGRMVLPVTGCHLSEEGGIWLKTARKTPRRRGPSATSPATVPVSLLRICWPPGGTGRSSAGTAFPR